MTNETTVLDEVLNATSLMHLTGADGKKPQRVYLMYARKVHPDMFQESADKEKADKAFAHLLSLKEQGEGKSPIPGSNSRRASKSTMTSKKYTYVMNGKFAENDTFTKYNATFMDGNEKALISILNDPRDNDLAEAHVDALRKLDQVSPDYRMYYPHFLEEFRFRDETTNIDRKMVVTLENKGFRTMADIFEEYPDGISARDVAWMFRRMLVAVGNAHDMGIVNGAPNVDAFMIHDEMHGIILADWQYSVPVGGTLKAVPSTYRDIYPEYALNKEPVDGSLDIHIISAMAEGLLEDNSPRQLFSFFQGCRLDKVPAASVLLAEFDQLLDRLYGKRTFHKFKLGRKGV